MVRGVSTGIPLTQHLSKVTYSFGHRDKAGWLRWEYVIQVLVCIQYLGRLRICISCRNTNHYLLHRRLAPLVGCNLTGVESYPEISCSKSGLTYGMKGHPSTLHTSGGHFLENKNSQKQNTCST